jgi:hypothetical protein
MDCKNARMLAEFRGNRETELPPEDDAELDQHLNSCHECRSVLRVERQIDSHIGRAMKSVVVPFGLKSKILDRLATERGAWHRRRIFTVAAAAAAVVLAVGIVTWKPHGKKKLDLDALIANDTKWKQNPKERLETWLAVEGIRYRPDVPLDPHLIAFHGMAEIQGKQVPMLVYRNIERNVTAQVFILRDADFDLSSLPQTSGGTMGYYGRKVEIVQDAEQPGKIAYLILYDGDSLEPFQIRLTST